MKEDFQYRGSQTLELDGGKVKAEVRFGSSTGIRLVRLSSSYRGESRRAEAKVRVEKGESPVVLSWSPVSAQAEDWYPEEDGLDDRR